MFDNVENHLRLPIIKALKNNDIVATCNIVATVYGDVWMDGSMRRGKISANDLDVVEVMKRRVASVVNIVIFDKCFIFMFAIGG